MNSNLGLYCVQLQNRVVISGGLVDSQWPLYNNFSRPYSGLTFSLSQLVCCVCICAQLAVFWLFVAF